jgi:hypothetical protein
MSLIENQEAGLSVRKKLNDFFQSGRYPLDYFNSSQSVGTGDATADTAAWATACSSGLPFQGKKGVTYNISSTVSITDKDIDFDGNGCSFQIVGDTSLLAAKAAYTNVTNITNIDNTTTVDLSNGTVTLLNEVTTLTVASTTGYAVGKLVKVFSDNLIPGEDPAENRKLAEFARVSAIGSGTIQLYSRLRNTYTTNPRVAIHNETYQFSMRNFYVKGQVSPDITWSSPYVTVTGYYKPYLERITATNLVERFLRLVSCYEPVTRDLTGKVIRTSLTYDAFGYLIQEVGCFNGRHYNPSGFDVRHVYSCSAAAATDLTAFVENYGGTVGTTVIGGTGFNCKTAAFEAHADAEDVTFIACIAEYAYSGEIGNPAGFGFRGRRTRALGCTAIGGNGYNFLADYADANNSRDHEVIDCKFIANPNQTGGANGDLAGFLASGVSGGRVTGIRVVNPTAIQKGQANPIFEATEADMLVIEPNIKASQSGASTGRIFEVNGNASISIRGGDLDYTGATGTQLRTARVTSSSATILIDGLRMNVPVTVLTALVQFVNVSGTAYIKNILTNRAPSTASGVIVGSGSPVYGIDYTVRSTTTELISASLSTLAVTYSSGTTQTVDIDHRMSPTIFVEATVSTTGIQINNISAGMFFGQLMFIRNLPTSTNTLQLTTGANRINISTNETIAIGRGFSLRWNGTDWIAA